MVGRAGDDQGRAAAIDHAGVLLIPGYGGSAEPLEPLRESLDRAGFEVRLLDIGDGTGDLRAYADQAISEARGMVLEGSTTVSLVGFSAGGVIGRIAATSAPQLFARVVTLASPHRGTAWASLAGGTACPEACQQLRPDSPLLRNLPQPDSQESWLAVYSPSDQVVIPPTSASLPGATNLEMPGLAHGEIPRDPAVIALVTEFVSAE